MTRLSDPPAVRRSRNNRLPATDHHYLKTSSYVEEVPVPDYRYASDAAYERFADLKYGIRIHWGLYSLQQTNASWPLLTMTNEQRAEYFQLYRQFNPRKFDADRWMQWFAASGFRMFAFTTKHCDGFSLFDTATRVKQRIDWTAPGGPTIEDCDFAFSVMDSPYRRDVVRELCEAARGRNLAIDLYFSHPDWYDADFRTYGYHPMMTPEGRDVLIPGEFEDVPNFQNGRYQAMGPNHTPHQRRRMLQRHRDQLQELLTNYGPIDMLCLDQWMAGDLWPAMRQTLLELRAIQPDVMFRARGIGNYGDYYTNEGFIPEDKQATNMPWFVTDAIAYLPPYDPDASRYKDGRWIVHSLVDSVAKGGGFMLTVGPDGDGVFHPLAVKAIDEAGEWLKVNGEAIYATRAREGKQWKEGDDIRFTRSKDRKTVYAHCLKWPGTRLKLDSVIPSAETSVWMLGVKEPLLWRRAESGIEIDIPIGLQEDSARPCKTAWVFKIGGLHE